MDCKRLGKNKIVRTVLQTTACLSMLALCLVCLLWNPFFLGSSVVKIRFHEILEDIPGEPLRPVAQSGEVIDDPETITRLTKILGQSTLLSLGPSVSSDEGENHFLRGFDLVDQSGRVVASLCYYPNNQRLEIENSDHFKSAARKGWMAWWRNVTWAIFGGFDRYIAVPSGADSEFLQKLFVGKAMYRFGNSTNAPWPTSKDSLPKNK